MKAVILLMMMAAWPALAAQERGNGGDAIVCENGTVTFYDLFEMEQRHHIVPAIPVGESWQEITSKLIDRLKDINPSRAYRFHQRLDNFLKEANFKTGMKLIDVPDTGVGFIPAGCTLEQLVIQSVPHFPTDRRYLVNKDIWDRLDDTNKAVLALHELILGDAIEDDLETSETTRYFNALIVGSRLEGMKNKPYIELLQSLGFSNADYHGVSVGFYYTSHPFPGRSPERKLGLVWEGESLLEAIMPRHFYADTPEIKGTATCAETGKMAFTKEGKLISANYNDTLPCDEMKLFYHAKVADTEIKATFRGISSNSDGAYGVGLGIGPLEISNPVLHIKTDLPTAQGFVDFGRDGKIWRIQASDGRDYREACTAVGEVFYRKKWQTVSSFEYEGGKVQSVALCPAKPVRVGWQTVPVQSVESHDEQDEYTLGSVVQYSFANARLPIESLTTKRNQPSVVTSIHLGKKITIEGAHGGKFVCEAGTEFSVNGTEVDLSQVGYFTCESPNEKN